MAALIFMIISYFHFSGGEISGIKNISTEDTVYAQLYDNSYQLIDEKKLNSSQIEAIKSLILNSHFTRHTEGLLYYLPEEAPYKYHINIYKKYTDEEDLHLEILGNSYFNACEDQNFGFLKIRTSDFEEKLKSILNMN